MSCAEHGYSHISPLLYIYIRNTHVQLMILQGFTNSVSPYRVMYMAIYDHITKYHEGNACLSRHSSSARSVSGSFISPRGRRFEYRPPGLINELQLFFLNSPKRHFFVYKPRGLYTSKYGIWYYYI